MNLLSLPDCVLDKIFEYLSYDDIAKTRLVSSQVNGICQSLLNRGIVKLRNSLSRKITELKPLLPRKESERWDHPAAIKSRYLESIQSKVRMLHYVYEGYIEMRMCCFIPGKFIDLAFDILRSGIYPKSWLHDTSLNEMSDASCMAKEHFQETIEPILKKMKVEVPMIKAPIQPLKATIVMKTNSNACQFPDGENCRKAYNRIDTSHRTLLRKLDSSKKAYDALLKKFNSNKKAVTEKLTKSQNEVAELRRRLEKLESGNKSEPRAQAEQNNTGETTNRKKLSLRSSKRLKKD